MTRACTHNFMFWNLVTVQYEKYHLHHILLFIVLLLYSIIGALIFCGLESGHEQVMNEGKNRDDVRRSVAAKKIFIDRVQFLYFQIPNASDFYETKLRIALDQYDTLMGIKPVLNQARKWDIWGGLYYAGTIYTTIGYGDLSASTVWGRLFTMVYAVIGIPMVITILNDWGTLMFQAIDVLWKNKFKTSIQWMNSMIDLKRARKGSDEIIYSSKDQISIQKFEEPDSDQQEPIPLFLVFIVLVFWVLLCTTVFSLFEEWTFFEAVYFFFISLTTIGFGDVTPSHRVAVANFLLILIGLSVVSMSVNVIQMQLEIIFARIVKTIDNDFKINLSVSADDNKKTATTSEAGEVEKGPSALRPVEDVIKQYGQSMKGTERLLMRFMSKHQKKMLNEKFEDRAKMRNKWTQTTTQIKVASVQTANKYDDLLNFPDEEEEEQPSKSRINAKRLYIYNTGE